MTLLVLNSCALKTPVGPHTIMDIILSLLLAITSESTVKPF